MTAELEVADSIPKAGPILRVFLKKKPRNKGSAFALQTVRPSRGSDDHVKWQPRLQWDT